MTKAEKATIRINAAATRLNKPPQPGEKMPVTYLISGCHWQAARTTLKEQIDKLQEAFDLLTELDQTACQNFAIPDDGVADGGEPYTDEELAKMKTDLELIEKNGWERS